MILLSLLFLWLFVTCTKQKAKKKSAIASYYCGCHESIFPDESPIITKNVRKKKQFQYSFVVKSFFYLEKRKVTHVPSSIVLRHEPSKFDETSTSQSVSLVESFTEPIFCCERCQEFAKKEADKVESTFGLGKSYGSTVLAIETEEDDLQYETEEEESDPGEDDESDTVSRDVICGLRSEFENVMSSLAQGKKVGIKRYQMIFNDFTKNNIIIGSNGRCPFIEYTLQSSSKAGNPVCKPKKWKRWYLDDVSETGSKKRCNSDYRETFIARSNGEVLDRYETLNFAQGHHSMYGKTTSKKIYRSSSAYWVWKGEQYTSHMIQWELDRFGGPLCVSDDTNWERNCRNHGQCHALSCCDNYVSCETSLPLAMKCFNLNMIRTCPDQNRKTETKIYWRWRDLENDLLNRKMEDFPNFVSLASHAFAAEKFPNVKMRVFDGCTHGVKNFYQVERKIRWERDIATLRTMYQDPDELQIKIKEQQPVHQMFDPFHGKSVKLSTMGKHFKRFEGFSGVPISPSLYNFAFEDCLYRISPDSDCWYDNAMRECMENVYGIADYYNRLDEIYVSEGQIRVGMRGAGRTTYLIHEERHDSYINCLKDTQYYYCHGKLLAYTDHRFSMDDCCKLKVEDFGFWRDRLVAASLTKTKDTDEEYLVFFDAVVEDISNNEYSSYAEKSYRKDQSNFFFYSYRIQNYGTTCKTMISSECKLVLQRMKELCNVCYSNCGTVKNKQLIILGQRCFELRKRVPKTSVESVLKEYEKKGKKKGKGKKQEKEKLVKQVAKSGETIYYVVTEKKLPVEPNDLYHYVMPEFIDACVEFVEVSDDNGGKKIKVKDVKKSVTCFVEMMKKKNVKRCPIDDYGYFSVECTSFANEGMFASKANIFPKDCHKDPLNFVGDFEISKLKYAFTVLEGIRKDEILGKRGENTEWYFSLSNPNNFWGKKDQTWYGFLEYASNEYVERGWKHWVEWWDSSDLAKDFDCNT